jgi:hypothetical protein
MVFEFRIIQALVHNISPVDPKGTQVVPTPIHPICPILDETNVKLCHLLLVKYTELDSY